MKYLVLLILGIALGSSDGKECGCREEIVAPNLWVDELLLDYTKNQECTGVCRFKIMPHPNHPMTLEIMEYHHSYNIDLRVRQTFTIGNDTTFEMIDVDPANYRGEIKLAANSGAVIEVEFLFPGEYLRAERVHVHFRRNNPVPHTCDSSIVIVENKLTQINKDAQSTWNFCNYAVSFPKNSGDVKTKYLVSVKYNPSVCGVSFANSVGTSFSAPISLMEYGFITDVEMFHIRIYKQTGDEWYKLPQISIEQIDNRCDCGTKQFELLNSEVVTLKSPGFSTAVCPGIQCSTTIDVEKTVGSNETESILWISMNATIGEHDTFSLKGNQRGHSLFSMHKNGIVQNVSLIDFVVPHQSITMNFQTDHSLIPRHYELTIRSMVIPKICQCSYYKQKDISKPGRKIINIPAECKFIYCNWNINMQKEVEDEYGLEDSRKFRTELMFDVKNPSESDEIHITTTKNRTISNYHDLQYIRRYSTKEPNVQFVYIRKNGVARQETQLVFYWSYVIATECSTQGTIIQLDDHKYALANKEWPEVYSPNEMCSYMVVAPENHTIRVQIDVIDIERYHDYLEFFNGNVTRAGGLIKSYSGYYKNETFDSIGRYLIINFNTDQEMSKHGFHINLEAVPPLIKSDDTSSGSSMVRIGIFLVVVIIAACFITIAVSKYKSRHQKRSPEHSVSFTNDHFNSLVSINRESEETAEHTTML